MKLLDREFIIILMLRATKENGKTINNMVTEYKPGRNFPIIIFSLINSL